MASRKTQRPPRNDALRVMTKMFGAAPGWEKGAADATAAAEIAEEVYALRERHGLTQLGLATLIGSSQFAVARMEASEYRGHSMAVLRRMAPQLASRWKFKFIAATQTMRPAARSKTRRLNHAELELLTPPGFHRM